VGAYLVKHPDVLDSLPVLRRWLPHLRRCCMLQPGQKHLKRVIAEMGGKNALIVDESADLDQAVVGVVQSAFDIVGKSVLLVRG